MENWDGPLDATGAYSGQGVRMVLCIVGRMGNSFKANRAGRRPARVYVYY